MLYFNRKTEYALIAIEHMVRTAPAGEGLVSVREIADHYHLPYPLLSKVLQKLANHGLVKSQHGTKGGYVLAREPQDISVADVMEIFEGPFAVADCFKEEKITCPQWDGCRIKTPLYQLNHKIQDLLRQTLVVQLVETRDSPRLALGEALDC